MKNCPSYPNPVVAAVLERRTQIRKEAAGEVVLMLDRGVEIAAQLRDESDAGFRAIHHYRQLETGQEIRYRSGDGEGRARVIWCRIAGNECESGFYILAAPSSV